LIPRSESNSNVAIEGIHGWRIYVYLPDESIADTKDNAWWGLEIRWDLLPRGKIGDSTLQVLYVANPLLEIGWPIGHVYWQEWARLSVAISNRVMAYDPEQRLFRWFPEKDLEGKRTQHPHGTDMIASLTTAIRFTRVKVPRRGRQFDLWKQNAAERENQYLATSMVLTMPSS